MRDEEEEEQKGLLLNRPKQKQPSPTNPVQSSFLKSGAFNVVNPVKFIDPFQTQPILPIESDAFTLSLD